MLISGLQAKRAEKLQAPQELTVSTPPPDMGSLPLEGAKGLPTGSVPAPVRSAGMGLAGFHSSATSKAAAPKDVIASTSMQPHAAAPGSDEVAECVICWDAAANVVLQPCGHVCACSGCAVVLEEALCPMCRCVVMDNIVLQL